MSLSFLRLFDDHDWQYLYHWEWHDHSQVLEHDHMWFNRGSLFIWSHFFWSNNMSSCNVVFHTSTFFIKYLQWFHCECLLFYLNEYVTISEPLSYSTLESASAACTVSHTCVIDQAQVEVEREVTTIEARLTVPWCGFELVGDNLDNTTSHRHQLVNCTTVHVSLHNFNSFPSTRQPLQSVCYLLKRIWHSHWIILRSWWSHACQAHATLHRLSDVAVKNIKHKYRTGALLGAYAYISTARKYALISEMRLITNTLRVVNHASRELSLAG